MSDIGQSRTSQTMQDERLTPSAAGRLLQAMRRTRRGGGWNRKPTPCPHCGTIMTVRELRRHISRCPSKS